MLPLAILTVRTLCSAFSPHAAIQTLGGCRSHPCVRAKEAGPQGWYQGHTGNPWESCSVIILCLLSKSVCSDGSFAKEHSNSIVLNASGIKQPPSLPSW